MKRKKRDVNKPSKTFWLLLKQSVESVKRKSAVDVKPMLLLPRLCARKPKEWKLKIAVASPQSKSCGTWSNKSNGYVWRPRINVARKKARVAREKKRSSVLSLRRRIAEPAQLTSFVVAKKTRHALELVKINAVPIGIANKRVATQKNKLVAPEKMLELKKRKMLFVLLRKPRERRWPRKTLVATPRKNALQRCAPTKTLRGPPSLLVVKLSRLNSKQNKELKKISALRKNADVKIMRMRCPESVKKLTISFATWNVVDAKLMPPPRLHLRLKRKESRSSESLVKKL